MTVKLPLPQDKKLTVVFRVEPGCLGPNGADLVEPFCPFAEKALASLDSDFVYWHIVPRTDKSLPEVEYKVGQKKLNHDQAAKYVAVFGKNLDEFEEHFHDQIAVLIDQYMQR